jgi:hypothetical protein
MENLIIKGKNFGSYTIVNDVMILNSDSRLILTVLPQGLVQKVDAKMTLNHNGTREDRQRAFEQNDYVQKGWVILIDLKVLDLIN